MAEVLNFSGKDTDESGSIVLTAGQLARVRWTARHGSARCSWKIVAAGVTSYIEIIDQELAVVLAFSGDVVSVVYDGQGNGNSAAAGVLEAVS